MAEILRLVLDFDEPEFARLRQAARREQRSPVDQAKVLVLRGLDDDDEPVGLFTPREPAPAEPASP